MPYFLGERLTERAEVAAIRVSALATDRRPLDGTLRLVGALVDGLAGAT